MRNVADQLWKQRGAKFENSANKNIQVEVKKKTKKTVGGDYK